MKYARRSLATIVSCAIVGLCLLAVVAPAAQAEGNWLLEGKSIKESLEIEGEKDKGPYAFLVPGLNLELSFEDFTITKGTLSTEGKGTLELLFTKGTVYTISPLEKTKCIVGDLLFKLKSSLFLHKGKSYDLLEPAEGSVMTVTTYGGECPLTEKNNVTGSMVLEDPSGNFETEAVKHLAQQAPVGLFPEHEMKFGTNAMHLDGSWWMALKGKNKGQKWSGIA